MINRQNYEEYFILYADNELKQAERKMVEEFVAVNTDLRKEFDLLTGLKLDPKDRMQFSDKSSLYRPIELKDDLYTPDAAELDMLMYLDNELEEEERLKFEKKLKTDKQVRADFDILLNTRMDPDFKVVFPDKSLLYRQTEKNGRIIRITWVRVAVAAAILLIAGLLWLNNAGDKISASGSELAGNSSTETIEKTDSGIAKEKIADKEKNQLAQEKVVEDKKDDNLADQTNQQTAQVNPGKEIQKKQPIPDRKKAGNSNEALADNNKVKPKSDINQKYSQDQALSKVEEVKKNEINAVQDQADSRQDQLNIHHDSSPVAVYAAATNIKSNYATEALLNNDEDADKNVQVIENEKPRKGALRGVFRKANRIFNKATNPDPSVPSVKVAGFEIALAQ